MRKIGQGQLTSGQECRGTLRVVESLEDVLRLMKTEVSEVVIFTHSASATAVIPLFAKIKGVICTSGGATSHLAIVAREFDLPCVMGSEVQDKQALDGHPVYFSPQGEIFIEP